MLTRRLTRWSLFIAHMFWSRIPQKNWQNKGTQVLAALAQSRNFLRYLALPAWFYHLFSVCWCVLPISAFGNTPASLCGLRNEIWPWLEPQWPICSSLPGTVLVLALKITYPGKFCSPRKMGQLVNLGQAFLTISMNMSSFSPHAQRWSSNLWMVLWELLILFPGHGFHRLEKQGTLVCTCTHLAFHPPTCLTALDQATWSWTTSLNSFRFLTEANNAS